MAIRNTGFKWYDGFFLTMLAFSIIMVAWSWRQYDKSTIGLENGWQLRGKHFFGRVVLLSITYAVLYPFLWIWTVVGAIWSVTGRDCFLQLPEKNQIWGFVIWLLFSFGGLICIAGKFGRKWLIRRRAHLRHAPRGTRVSEFKVLLNMIRQPNNLVYEAAAHENRSLDQEATVYNPRIQMSQSMVALVEALIQRLPIFILRDIPTDCSDCPICLEEFRVGQGVRGLPCAHNFHVPCIDQWLRVNMRCPRCRCVVFPIVSRNNASAVPVGPEQSTVPATQPVRTQPYSVSYFMRMQSFLMPARADNPPPLEPTDNAPALDPSPSMTPTSTSSNTDAPPCESTPSPSASPTSISSNGPGTASEIFEIEGETSQTVK